MIISPWIDVFIVSILVYLIEYGFYKYKKANIYETKYMIIWWLIDIWLLLFFWILYYWKWYIFPFGLSWFWYCFIISLIIELAVIKLYNIKL